MSQQWEDAHSDWSRGLVRLVRLWLRHGTLLGACRGLRTSGAAVPFVLARLSNTPARRSTQARFEPCEADVSQQWEDAHSDWSRGLVRLWPRHGTLLSACRGFRTSGAAVTFVLGKFQDVWKVPRHVGLPL